MIQKMYTVYDAKASYFLTPWPARSEGIARREFASACQNPEAPMHKYPADFILYEVGAYNDADGALTAVSPVIRICDGVEILQSLQVAK